MNQSSPGLLRQSTYESIKSLIITGQIAPGSRVTETDLSDRLGVSRTPIREALTRLERDGLVIQRAKQGFAVADFDLAKAEDVFALRVELECFAVRLACRNMDNTGRARLHQMIADCDALEATPERSLHHNLLELQIGLRLHHVIAELSGNALLADTLNGLLDQCQIYIWMDLTRFDHWNEARAEHRALVDGICAGDAETAQTIVRQHIEDTARNVAALLMRRKDIWAATLPRI
ncbi:GntR family transcriptional regulator [Pseudotabrizicola alkalilacus]|nr:GntR family transcriptional regulator [Pseudotabrizicola alkalilacus]